MLDPPATASAAKRDKGWLWYWDYDALAWAKYSVRESDDSSDDDDELEPNAQIAVWHDWARPQPKSRPTRPTPPTPPAKKPRA